jgi:hypothetical protein
MKGVKTLYAKIPVITLTELLNSAFNDVDYADDESPYKRKIHRCIATAERAIKIATLRAQPRHEKKK